MSVIFLFLFIIIASVNASADVSPTVHVSSGLVSGRLATNLVSGQPYYAFQGIPYAEPPMGKLRFKAPVKPKLWNSILATKADASECFQGHGGDEDCLYLNVFTTTLPNNSGTSNGTLPLRPVMVYIHGGAFVKGSSTIRQYGPEFLIEKGIVLVTLNYRLNVFGFVNSMDGSSDGNVGLKDQIAALQWVQENIDKFSGDPESVTLVGHSAGGVSVEYLIQSTLTKGLFHRAIALSGSAISERNLQPKPQVIVRRLALALGLQHIENTAELVDKLRTISATELYKASVNYSIMGEYDALKVQPFAPSIEHDSPDALITKCSYKSLEQQQQQQQPIPYMAGYVSYEGLLFLPHIQDNRIDLMKYKREPLILLPRAFNSSSVASTVKDRIIDYFFKNGSITSTPTFLTFMSEEFVRTIRKSVDLMRTNQNVYFYKFSYKTNNSAFHREGYDGVAHADELVHLFHSADFKESAEDVRLREKMTTLFTNFIKTGDPTPITDPLLDNIHWPSVAKSKDDGTTCLTIDNTLQLADNPDKDNFQFWDDLFEKYANKPICTW